jgi:uncharacterized protein YkwD
MFLALIVTISLHLTAGLAGSATSDAADAVPNSSWQQISRYDGPGYDAEAARQLAEMANADRLRAGLPPLRFDEGLARAARAHAAKMAAEEHLAHQFPGEPPLVERIGGSSTLHLERAGENVALAPTSDQAHRALMSSSLHRDNLLSPTFNVAGFGVFRRGRLLYVAQDFGLSAPTYSLAQARELVVLSVERLRAQAKMPRLERVEDREAQSGACRMAQADSINGGAPPPGAYMLRYTSMQPEKLPASISQLIAQGGLRTYAAGTCYARTATYPNGAYWVVLVFY